MSGFLRAALSKIIELLGLERFRKRIPWPRRHPRFRGCGLAPAIPPPQSPLACLPAGVDQAAIHLHGAAGEGVEPLQTGVAVAVIIHVEAVGPVQAERPAIAGQAGCRQGGARQGDLSGRLRFAIRLAVSLTRPWPSASGRCRTTGVPILCRKRSSRASALPGSTGWPPAVRFPELVRLPARVRRAVSGEGRWAPGYPRSRSRRRPQRQAPPGSPRPRCGEPLLRECRRGPAPCRDGAGPGRSAQNSDSGTTDPAGRCRCTRC